MPPQPLPDDPTRPARPSHALPPPPPRRAMAAGHAIVVVVVALGLGSLFNAPALADAAGSRPFGWQRSVAVAAVTPLRAVAGLLSLDRPHRTLSAAAAEATGTVGSPVSAASGTASVLPPPPAAPREDIGDTTRSARRPASPPSPPSAPSPPSPPDPAGDPDAAGDPDPRAPATRGDPLRLWVGGDSLTSELGPALAEMAAATGKASVEVDFRYSTGLTRPDFFDWPAHLAAVLSDYDPDALVVMFGANDAQNLQVEQGVLAFGTAAWRQEYARRVGALMDRLGADGRDVQWVGQPVMRDAGFDARMDVLNTIYEAEAATREAVTYVDSQELFASADGGYAPYLPDDDGTPILMRQQDGIHLSRAGGERLATVVLAPLAERWQLTE